MEDQVRDLVKFGVPEDRAREWVESHAPEAPAEVGVFPENWPAVRVFLRLTGRAWRRNPMNGKMTELIPSEVKATLELMGVRRREWPALFDKIDVLEAEGLKALYER